MPEQLLAFSGPHQAAANAIEQSDAEFVFQVVDLAGECRLRDAEADRRFGDGALLGDSNERSQVAQVHAASLCRFSIKSRVIRYWTNDWSRGMLSIADEGGSHEID